MNKTGRSTLSGVAVLIPLLIFALLSMMLTAMGISVYKGVVDGSEQNYNRRMAVSYITNRVRRADRVGKVSVGKFGEGDALFLSSDYSGTEYVTKIYYYNGSICELFCPAGYEVAVSGGTAIIPVQSFSLSQSDGFVTVTVTDEHGSVNTAVIALKGVSQ